MIFPEKETKKKESRQAVSKRGVQRIISHIHLRKRGKSLQYMEDEMSERTGETTL